MEEKSRGLLKKRDFMPLPMPNPLCAAIGYFLVMDGEVTPLVPLWDIDRVIECTKNAHFARAERELEILLRDLINDLYANPGQFPDAQKLLQKFKALFHELFPEEKPISQEQRRRIAEERIKTVYLMQFMDSWTFDSERLSKCSCQHLLPDKRIVPSCGYYTFHRKFDPRFQLTSALSKFL
jgi:uncharacterized radical SAM superfamily Fe-S cluster-containing enzyme